MFGRRIRAGNPGDAERDERLSALLSAWQDKEPSAEFNAGVWQRIRGASRSPTQGVSVLRLCYRGILPHPGWATALASSAAIMIGIAAGLSSRASPENHAGSNPLFHGQTLAGTYLAMAKGDIR